MSSTTFRPKNQVENFKSELLYWVRPTVHPGQHPLSRCQGKGHVGTGSALLSSSLPDHGSSCSSVKSCLQILVVSDCLQLPSSEIHLSFFLTPFFFPDTFGLPTSCANEIQNLIMQLAKKHLFLLLLNHFLIISLGTRFL